MKVAESRVKLELRFILMEFGYLPLLYYMEDLVREEQYELCKLIIDSLREYNRIYNLDIPLVLNDVVIDRYIAENPNGEETVKNIKNFVWEIQRRLIQNIK